MIEWILNKWMLRMIGMMIVDDGDMGDDGYSDDKND